MGFERDPDEVTAVIADVVDAAPDIVFCGFGFPKQEQMIADLRRELPQAWFLGCGAALSFVAQTLPRAPVWMQRAGLEWLHRFLREPRRLFRRYFVNDVPFLGGLFVAALVSRIGGERRRTSRGTATGGGIELLAKHGADRDHGHDER
jgi:N-acetylglucosaminyldiphosphoundecaprenol N-acetyl-beta-D-mannosaminyltransferase